MNAFGRGFGRARNLWVSATWILGMGTLLGGTALGAAGLTEEQLLQMRSVRDVAVAPAGDLAAYVLDVPRRAGVDEDGPVWKELHLVPLEGPGAGESRGFVIGEVNVSNPSFGPNGDFVLYTAKRNGDEEGALWAIPVDGGESRKVLEQKGMDDYRLSPDGKFLAVLVTPSDEAREEAKKKGYDREVFEEEWQPRELWIFPFPELDPAPVDPSAEATEPAEPIKLSVEGSVGAVEWAADGSRLAIGIQPRNLVDDDYMQRRVRVIDAADGKTVARFENPGKLADFALSPNGLHLAMISARDHSDPSPGRLKVGKVADGSLTEVMPDYEAHVRSLVWTNPDTLVWTADEGSETTLGSVRLGGKPSKLLRSDAAAGVPIMHGLHLGRNGRLVFAGESPSHPRELFTMRPRERPKRLTDSNPWLENVDLGKQEVITWTASDGLELEGILIHPVDGAEPAPLLLMVHGGPEANDRNGWLSNYSRPGQVSAGRGYAVLYPNYRGSTGRGVDFTKLGHGDAAGKEFQDLVESVDHLQEVGIASDRVGITGGSYGGYATAWCSTYYTDRFRAGVMFVGISNKLSKGFTTDIPLEDIAVHTTFPPWTKWQFSLERSPIYHAGKSKTPLLIATGTADTRVHPSQSLQLYRAMKMQDKTVRFVRYPGEPHGNRRAASQEEHLRRLLRWMDHFVKEDNTDLPPRDLPAAKEL